MIGSIWHKTMNKQTSAHDWSNKLFALSSWYASRVGSTVGFANTAWKIINFNQTMKVLSQFHSLVFIFTIFICSNGKFY